MKQSSQHMGSEQHADEGSAARRISTLAPASPKLIHLRDGELVLYRRPRSLLYQCRFKRPDGRSHRQSTGKASLEQAIPRACDIYDEARYRLRLGLAHRTHSIAHIAQLCVAELRQQIDLRGKKTSLNDYVSVIMAAELPICLLRV